jgi:hypothetical protein
MIDVTDGVRRFRAYGIRPEISLEIMLRKKIKMHAAGQGAVVNPDGQTKPVGVMAGFLRFNEPVITRLSIWNQIFAQKELVAFLGKSPY